MQLIVLISCLLLTKICAFYLKSNKIQRSPVYSQTKVDFYEKPRRKNQKQNKELNIADFETYLSGLPNNNEYTPTGNKINEQTLYTLVWYDCKECEQLLEEVYKTGLQFIYINGTYYFYDPQLSDNKPLLYKDDEFFTDDIFDIYTELFSM
jgi:uncharacterized protein YxeA